MLAVVVFNFSQFRSVSALLTGAEFRWDHQIEGTYFGGRFETEVQADFVRGIDRTNQGNLPRMPPIREGIALNYRNQGWTGQFQIQRSEKQGLLASEEQPTDAFEMVNLGVEAPIATSFGSFRLSFRVNNLLNQEGRLHTSFLKDLAPLPGRNFLLGFQAVL